MLYINTNKVKIDSYKNYIITAQIKFMYLTFFILMILIPIGNIM